MSKKQRKYEPEFKIETVIEGLRGEKSVAQICRERNISDSLYYKWRDIFLENAPEIFTTQGQQQQASVEKDARIADLERMVGKLALEIEILKKARHWLSTPTRRNGT